MSLFLIAFTDRGKALADTLAAALDGESVRCGEPLGLREWTAAHFQTGNNLVFIGAAGIAVRAVAPYVRDKTADPAVVVVDEAGGFAIPILSGHLGGANDLARSIAKLCGAVPVLTTATDVNGVFAVDEWAKRQNCVIPNAEKIKEVSSLLLSGGTVRLRSDWPIAGEPPRYVCVTGEKDYDVLLSLRTRGKDVLRLVPRIAVLGVGCRRGTPRDAIEAALTAMLGKSSLYEQAICAVATIDLKKDEPGLIAFCQAHGWPLRTYSAEQLKRAEGNFTASAFVERVTGVDNVCERAAVLAANDGPIRWKKTAGNGVTMAVALMKPYHPTWRWRDE